MLVYRGTVLMQEVILLEVPVALCVTYMDNASVHHHNSIILSSFMYTLSQDYLQLLWLLEAMYSSTVSYAPIVK